MRTLCFYWKLSSFPYCSRQKWHPDKCSASGNEIRMKEAKQQFQEIQKAYSGSFPVFSSPLHPPFPWSLQTMSSNDDKDTKLEVSAPWFSKIVVCLFHTHKKEAFLWVPVLLSCWGTVLSDSNKRFLYDVGAYDKADDKDEEVNQLLLWCDSSIFPLFLSITPFVAGDGGVSWGDGANDEANQTLCKSLVFELLWIHLICASSRLRRRGLGAGERPGELRAAAADVRGDVPRRSGRGILRLLLGHLGRGVLRQQAGQLSDGLGQAEAGRVGPGRHWVLPRGESPSPLFPSPLLPGISTYLLLLRVPNLQRKFSVLVPAPLCLSHMSIEFFIFIHKAMHWTHPSISWLLVRIHPTNIVIGYSEFDMLQKLAVHRIRSIFITYTYATYSNQ